MLTKGMSQDAVLTQMLLDPGSMAVDVEDVDDFAFLKKPEKKRLLRLIS